MKPETADLSRLADALEGLRQEVARLGGRVAALETAAAAVAAPAADRGAPAAPAAAEGLGEEMVLVVSAAVAAFLPRKAPIRQIRLLGTAAWAQQGRVTMQAAHDL